VDLSLSKITNSYFKGCDQYTALLEGGAAYYYMKYFKIIVLFAITELRISAQYEYTA
jgi:hypothetical protein